MTINRFQLGDLSFDSADIPSMMAIINNWLKNTVVSVNDACTSRAIAYVNPHVYNIACEHRCVSQFINRCSLVCVDGIGVAMILRRKSVHSVSRVVALHLFDALLNELDTPCTGLLIGVSSQEVRQSARNINALHSNLHIVASMDGYANAAQYEQFLKQHAQVQWVLIGAGSPKSEGIALQALKLCKQSIVFHIGAGTIKVYAGTKRRAPDWVSRAGMEWAHRVLFEPHTRERYTKGTVRFFKTLNRYSKGTS